MNIFKMDTYDCVMMSVFFFVLIASMLILMGNNYTLLKDVNDNVVEGFTAADSEKAAEKINTDTAKIIDELHIDKYRTNYEDIINNMKVWTDSMMLKSIVSNGVDTNSNLTSDNLKKISHINHLESFKKSCDLALNVLDNN